MTKKLLNQPFSLFGFFFLIFSLQAEPSQAQGTPTRDSIYIDKGVNNTNDFEGDTRIYFLAQDEQGRTLDKVIHKKSDAEDFVPFRRHLSVYQGPNLTNFRIQAWNAVDDEWLDIREDIYSYEGNLLIRYLRRTFQNGALQDYRRWQYTYDTDGNEESVWLQEKQNDEWENLSQKMMTYNEAGELASQALQRWVDSAWKNSRRRNWEYDMATSLTRKVTVEVWDTPTTTWIPVFIQTFSYNADGRWTGSAYEAWDQDNQIWVNTQRTEYLYNDQQEPTGQVMQDWENNAWRNNLRGGLSLDGTTQIATIQHWNDSADDWENFLRYQRSFDEGGLEQSQLGMEAWDASTGNWINKNFTRRYTYFWSEAVVNAIDEAQLPSSCKIPNPYTAGLPFSCGSTSEKGPINIELFDMMGRRVLYQTADDQASGTIDSPPVPGVYILRISQQKAVQHIQRLVIQ